MLKYKDVFVAKGSALYDAMQLKDTKESKKACEKVYKATTANYAAKYSKEDRDWFSNWKQCHVS